MKDKYHKVIARIVSKNTFINSSERSFHSIYVFQNNFITFELSTRERIVLEVSPSVFSYFIVGDEGELTYEVGNKSLTFLNFSRMG